MTEGIRGLADEYYEYRLRVEPTLAHLLGDYRYVDLVEDVSRDAEDADIDTRRGFAARAAAIDPSHLEGDDLITRETLIFDAETQLPSLKATARRSPLTQSWESRRRPP